MLQTATILLAITALGGPLMAGIRFATKANPPAWLAMLHGLLAASGLTLLIYTICTTPVPAMTDAASGIARAEPLPFLRLRFATSARMKKTPRCGGVFSFARHVCSRIN